MIGIDFGTTRTKVAYLDPSGKPNIIPNGRGEESTPTVVQYGTAGPPLVGTDAVEQGFVDPANCVANFKLDLGSTKNLLQNGQVVTPTDAAAVVIGKVKEDAEAFLNRKIDEVVVTCPANFRDDGKQALKEACERNGLKVLRLVHEPTAAAIAYALSKQGHNTTFLVYDFGGGTFDVSIVCVKGNEIDILASEGVPRLGGNDLNDCIRNRVLDEVAAKFGHCPVCNVRLTGQGKYCSARGSRV